MKVSVLKDNEYNAIKLKKFMYELIHSKRRCEYLQYEIC